jgi:hypothetical protein
VSAALVAAGCGGSSSDTKANKAYADSVCTAIGSWQQQIKSIASDFSGGISKSSLQAKLQQAQAATTLVTQIKTVPPPNSSQGQAAKQQIDQLTSDAKMTVNAAQTSVAQIPDNASAKTILTEVIALAPQVKSLATEAKSAIDMLKSTSGSLASAFKNTKSCTNLG